MNWNDIGISNIISGKNANGVAYLKLFLQDYTALTSEVVNAGCSKCIAKYFNNYLNLTTMQENKSQYQLRKKREGLPLKFGSSIRVTNKNITDEYAEILIKRFQDKDPNFNLKYLFDKYPTSTKKIEVKKAEVVSEKPKELAIETPKTRRKKVSKK